MQDLERVVASMAAACVAVGVPLVTGDTKVVDRGKGDGIYVNTSGIGRVRDGVSVGPGRAAVGDVVIVSGPIGDHGIAVMAAREGIDFETALVSDSAPVVAPVRALLRRGARHPRPARPDARGAGDRPLRDRALLERRHSARRGGDPGARPEVQGACELLGFDPLYVACEGRFLAIVPGERADAALAAIRSQPGGEGARRIGTGRRRGPRPARAEDPDRQPPAARAALRRAAAEDLLMSFRGTSVPGGPLARRLERTCSE